MRSLTIETPTGQFALVEDDGAIVRAEWGCRGNEQSPLLDEAARQVEAYYTGDLTEFDLPLDVRGSDLQKNVCDAMLAIPFGQTRTYGGIARQLGAPAQAIGHACGGNPIALIIPCHRVLGSCGLGGFSGAGGVETKVALLRREGAASLLI